MAGRVKMSSELGLRWKWKKRKKHARGADAASWFSRPQLRQGKRTRPGSFAPSKIDERKFSRRHANVKGFIPERRKYFFLLLDRSASIHRSLAGPSRGSGSVGKGGKAPATRFVLETFDEKNCGSCKWTIDPQDNFFIRSCQSQQLERRKKNMAEGSERSEFFLRKYRSSLLLLFSLASSCLWWLLNTSENCWLWGCVETSGKPRGGNPHSRFTFVATLNVVDATHRSH